MARRYEMQERAKRVEATRRRIVEATSQLHAEVGPARTTVAEIAARAGVSRPTVYNQFPDDASLFAACGALFFETVPRPALDALGLEQALAALYDYYRRGGVLLEHALRDAEVLPSLAAVMRPFDDYLETTADRLAGGATGEARALIGLALAYSTWRTLTREGSLGDSEAASTMARAVRCVLSR